MRLLRVLAPLGLATVLAVAGTVITYVLLMQNVAGPVWLRAAVLGRLQPFPGRVLGRNLQPLDVVTWLVGLVVLLVVVAAFVLLAARSGALAAFLGGWIGTTVAGAVAAFVGALLSVGRLFPDSAGGSRFGEQRALYVVNAFGGGMYWGFFAGVLVGLAAVVVAARRPAAATAPTVQASRAAQV